MQKSNCWNSRD